MITMDSATVVIEPVKEAVTAASFLNHLKNNRIEYLLAVGVLHLLGVSNVVIAKVSGVCF